MAGVWPVKYDLTALSPDEVDQIDAELASSGVDRRWTGALLSVGADDSWKVDALLAERSAPTPPAQDHTEPAELTASTQPSDMPTDPEAGTVSAAETPRARWWVFDRPLVRDPWLWVGLIAAVVLIPRTLDDYRTSGGELDLSDGGGLALAIDVLFLGIAQAVMFGALPASIRLYLRSKRGLVTRPLATRPWAVVVLLFGGILFAGFAAGAISDGPQDTIAAETAFAGGRISDHDAAIVEEIGRHPDAWNEAAGRFIASYQDPLVTANSWVRTASNDLIDMRAAVNGFAADVESLDSSTLRQRFLPMVGNYQDKLEAAEALIQAVRNGDVDGEERAATALERAAADGQELATEFLRDIAEIVGRENMRDALDP